jgi:hypothetical protein
MNRYKFCLIAAIAASVFVRAVDAAGPDLDIAGFKVGMSEADAMAAIKAHNPRLVMTQPSHQLEGFSVAVQPSASGMVLPTDSFDGEKIELLFTMPPGQQVLWGMRRTTSYAAPRRPSAEATVAALREKYGTENIPPDRPGLQTVNMGWILDSNGNLLPQAEAKQAYMSCFTPLQRHFGNDDVASFNDIQVGMKKDALPSNSVSLITANVESTQRGDIWVVVNLTVTMNAGPVYGPAIELTRAQVLQASKERQDKESNDIKNRGVPSL